jgi:hypothetical protein
MKVFTTYPVTINKKRINAPDYYLNADGEQYIPFDGRTELEAFQDECGETFYCSADGEDFYNAKGEKLKGFFKKVGGGVVKVGQFIGKVAKKVGRTIVEASKKVVSGVKTAGGKVKAGAEKLLHHKTKAERTKSKADRDKKRADKVKEHAEAKAKREKEIADAKAKGQTPPPPIPPLPKETAEDKVKADAKAMADENKDTDLFTKVLPPAKASTPPENIVDVGGKKYDATDIPKGKEIVETIDESGNKVAGVEFKPKEVVAVTGGDGNIQYYTNEDAGGMSKGLKVALIVGGSLLVLGIVGFVIYKSRKK